MKSSYVTTEVVGFAFLLTGLALAFFGGTLPRRGQVAATLIGLGIFVLLIVASAAHQPAG